MSKLIRTAGIILVIMFLTTICAGSVLSQSIPDHFTYLPLISHNSFSDFEITWADVTRIIDGDTVELSTGKKVRYIGMDTPEMTGGPECYAVEAKEKNRELVEGKRVALRKDVSETDRYGRLLRYVYLPNGEMVNAILVRDGYATAATFPPDVMFADLFVALERQAREAGRGLWGPVCQITPTPSPTITPTTMPSASPTATQTHQATATPSTTPTNTAIPPSMTPKPPTSTVQPTWTPRAGVVRINGSCSQFNAPGNDNNNLNEEWVCFTNQGSGSASMTSWRVEDEANHTYFFPAFTLPGGATVKLHTGSGNNSASDLYWGSGRAIWNNGGDTVFLYDAVGNLVDQYIY